MNGAQFDIAGLISIIIEHCGQEFVMNVMSHLGRVTNDQRWPDVIPPHLQLYSNSLSCRTAQDKHAFTSILNLHARQNNNYLSILTKAVVVGLKYIFYIILSHYISGF